MRQQKEKKRELKKDQGDLRVKLERCNCNGEDGSGSGKAGNDTS